MSMSGEPKTPYLMRMQSALDRAARRRSLECGLCDGLTVAKPAALWSRSEAERS